MKKVRSTIVFGAGAGAAFLLDPERGQERRSGLMEQVLRAVGRSGTAPTGADPTGGAVIDLPAERNSIGGSDPVAVRATA